MERADSPDAVDVMTLGSSGARRVSGSATRAVVVASLVLFLALALRYWDHTVDDAFISFRYARNLARGLGLVYNAGERVEGYTNFLWVVLLAAGEKLGVAPESLARLAGTAAGVGVVIVVVRFAAQRVRSLPALAIPALFLAAHPALAAWSTGGLETTLFAFFAAYAVCRVADEIEHTPVRMGAGQAGHEKFNLEYVLRRDPTFVVVGVYALSNGASVPQVTPYYPIELALLSSPVFHERYRPVVGRTAAGAFTFFARVPSGSSAANAQQVVHP